MTYISSRAFPSTLLDSAPSLVSTPNSYPILLPGVDALNHSRATPVSWVTTHLEPAPSAGEGAHGSKISLVLHNATPAHAELLNNYGPKPNAELILGYGFTLENNPDDTIVLKLGGTTTVGASADEKRQWEVGRGAKGFEPLWEFVLGDMRRRRKEEEEEEGMDVDEGEGEDEEVAAVAEVQDVLQAAMQLDGMVELLMDKLPSTSTAEQSAESGIIRSEVARMLVHYVDGACRREFGFLHLLELLTNVVLSFTGQRDILESIREFVLEKHENIIQWAKQRGLPIVEEEEEGEE